MHSVISYREVALSLQVLAFIYLQSANDKKHMKYVFSVSDNEVCQELTLNSGLNRSIDHLSLIDVRCSNNTT